MLTVNPMDPMDMDIAMDKVRVRDEGAKDAVFCREKTPWIWVFWWVIFWKTPKKIKFHMVSFDGDF